MKLDPKDIFINYTKFKQEILDGINTEIDDPGAIYHSEDQEMILSREEKYSFLMYLLELNNVTLDENQRGKYKVTDFLLENPQLLFYRYILLKDPFQKYNIGYFNKNFEFMIDTIAGLNDFFFDTYLLCKQMDRCFDWKILKKGSPITRGPLNLRFNNILIISYTDNKPQLQISEEGLLKFKKYKPGKIGISLLCGKQVLFTMMLSVPELKNNIKEAILKDEVGDKKKISWEDIFPKYDEKNKKSKELYEEINNWKEMIGL